MPNKFIITRGFLKVLLCLKENPESNTYDIMKEAKMGFKSVMGELYTMKQLHLIRPVRHGQVEHYILSSDGEKLLNELIRASLSNLCLPLEIKRKSGKTILIAQVKR